MFGAFQNPHKYAKVAADQEGDDSSSDGGMTEEYGLLMSSYLTMKRQNSVHRVKLVAFVFLVLASYAGTFILGWKLHPHPDLDQACLYHTSVYCE